MVRAIARTLEPIHELHVLLNQSGLMRYAEIAHSYLAMTKESPYSDEPDKPLEPRPGADSKYFIVYPMWKKRDWYRLPDEERMRVMRDHIAVARRFPGIETNTAYSFGLDDQEFVVAFDADDPAQFLDLVQALRATESAAYTESETPIFTCISGSLERVLDALDGERGWGAGLADRVARGVEQLVGRRELHPRAAVRLAGGLLDAVDRLPPRVGHVVGLALGQQLLERVAARVGGLVQAPGVEVLEQRVDRLLGVALVGADDPGRARA